MQRISFSSTRLLVGSPLGLCAWSHSSGRGQPPLSWRRRSGRCGAFRSRHQDPPLHHKCREGGHHANRDTACPLEGMQAMCGSPHSSPAVHSMMRDQVVVATRGLAELCCWRLFFLVLTKEVSTVFIGCCRPGRPTRGYSVVIPASRTATNCGKVPI